MRLRLTVLAVLCALVVPASAGAVLGGRPDTAHPYVALVGEGHTVCSGTLLSPTVLLTAAHCFAAEGEGSTADVYFGPAPTPGVGFFPGTYYFDPEFGPTGGGVPGLDSHDVAVVVFSIPIPAGVTGGQYAQLPTAGLVDTLAMNAAVDLVGYGVQGFSTGGGPPQPAAAFTRAAAQTTMIASSDRLSSTFLKLHAGACFGDSGGPDLLAGTNVVLAENSFVLDNVCAGNTYSYRVDTPEALASIAALVALGGGSL